MIAGILCLVAAAALGPAVMFVQVAKVMRAGLDEFRGPGTFRSEVEHDGRHYLWRDSSELPERSAEAGEIEVRDADGDRLEIVPDRSVTVTTDSRERRSIGYVRTGPGEVEIRVAGGPESARLSFGPNHAVRVLRGMFFAVVICALLVLGGLVLITVGIVRAVRAPGERAAPATPHSSVAR